MNEEGNRELKMEIFLALDRYCIENLLSTSDILHSVSPLDQEMMQKLNGEVKAKMHSNILERSSDEFDFNFNCAMREYSLSHSEFSFLTTLVDIRTVYNSTKIDQDSHTHVIHTLIFQLNTINKAYNTITAKDVETMIEIIVKNMDFTKRSENNNNNNNNESEMKMHNDNMNSDGSSKVLKEQIEEYLKALKVKVRTMFNWYRVFKMHNIALARNNLANGNENVKETDREIDMIESGYIIHSNYFSQPPMMHLCFHIILVDDFKGTIYAIDDNDQRQAGYAYFYKNTSKKFYCYKIDDLTQFCNSIPSYNPDVHVFAQCIAQVLYG